MDATVVIVLDQCHESFHVHLIAKKLHSSETLETRISFGCIQFIHLICSCFEHEAIFEVLSVLTFASQHSYSVAVQDSQGTV